MLILFFFHLVFFCSHVAVKKRKVKRNECQPQQPQEALLTETWNWDPQHWIDWSCTGSTNLKTMHISFALFLCIMHALQLFPSLRISVLMPALPNLLLLKQLCIHFHWFSQFLIKQHSPLKPVCLFWGGLQEIPGGSTRLRLSGTVSVCMFLLWMSLFICAGCKRRCEQGWLLLNV